MVAVHSVANLILGQAISVFHFRACPKILFATLMSIPDIVKHWTSLTFLIGGTKCGGLKKDLGA